MTNLIKSSVLVATLICASAKMFGADLSGNPVIAKGNGFEIKRGDLEDAMAAYKPQIQNLSADQLLLLQKQILTNLINSKLLLAKATDDDKAAGKKSADLQVTSVIESVGSQEAFAARLKTNGLTEAQFRAKITDDATAQAVLQRELKISVTDDEIKQFYDQHGVDFEQPEMAHISHILIYTVDPVTHKALSSSDLELRRKLADNIMKAARSGADFSKLAKQYSEDPGSKANGGELFPFPRGLLLPEIEDVAFSLTNSAVSDVVTTSIGYEIVKEIERIPSKKAGFLTVSSEIKQSLLRQKFTQAAPDYLENLQKAANVTIVDPSLNGANAGSPKK